MSMEIATSETRESGAAASLDVLQAGLFYLLSRYAATPSSAIASAVVDQLTALWSHPQADLLPIQRRVYANLMNEWRGRCGCCAGHQGALH